MAEKLISYESINEIPPVDIIPLHILNHLESEAVGGVYLDSKDPRNPKVGTDIIALEEFGTDGFVGEAFLQQFYSSVDISRIPQELTPLVTKYNEIINVLGLKIGSSEIQITELKNLIKEHEETHRIQNIRAKVYDRIRDMIYYRGDYNKELANRSKINNLLGFMEIQAFSIELQKGTKTNAEIAKLAATSLFSVALGLFVEEDGYSGAKTRLEKVYNYIRDQKEYGVMPMQFAAITILTGNSNIINDIYEGHLSYDIIRKILQASLERFVENTNFLLKDYIFDYETFIKDIDLQMLNACTP